MKSDRLMSLGAAYAEGIYFNLVKENSSLLNTVGSTKVLCEK